MKNLIISIIKQILLVLFIWLISLSTNAQKLPSIQKESLVTPADLKIDGKATEWDNKFQAHNKNTDVFYSIANSKDKLYLIIQVTDPAIIDKVFAGGITLTISNIDKKSNLTPVAVTFPIILQKDRSGIIHKIKDPEIKTDDQLAGINNQLSIASKTIKITGVKEFTDSVLSVYNENEIKAVSLFDGKKDYTYELLLPLKYFDQLLNNDEFKYDVKLNGLQVAMMMQVNGKPMDTNSPEYQSIMATVSGSNVTSAIRDPSGKVTFESSSPMQNLLNPTNFSGKYTLAKK